MTAHSLPPPNGWGQVTNPQLASPSITLLDAEAPFQQPRIISPCQPLELAEATTSPHPVHRAEQLAEPIPEAAADAEAVADVPHCEGGSSGRRAPAQRRRGKAAEAAADDAEAEAAEGTDSAMMFQTNHSGAFVLHSFWMLYLASCC